MFGAFHSTLTSMGGLVWKRRFGLTPTQKYRHRKRLKSVDQVIETLVQSGVQLKALEVAKRMPKEHQLTPLQKYWVPSKRYKDGYKPIHWVPKWTRVAHPRAWTPTTIHEIK